MINEIGTQVLIGATAVWLLYEVIRALHSRSKGVKLRGPKSTSWLFGLSRETSFQAEDQGALAFENWAKQYGDVYNAPGAFGSTRFVIFDPKAIQYFYSKETFTFVQSTFSKRAIAAATGKNLLTADGESHKRQRRALAPAFTAATLRSLTPIFYDSAYKAKASFDSIIESSNSSEAIIDVQKWMNCISFDTIGVAGFGHEFGSLEGRQSDVKDMFEVFGSSPPKGLSVILPLLGPVLPLLQMIPNERERINKRLNRTLAAISSVLLQRSRKDKEMGDSDFGRTIMGTLAKSENPDAQFMCSESEVTAQMKLLFVAGYETTAISLTWALIELSRNPEKQERLREELARFTSKDPTYDELINSLPYLDSVMREVLRVHPPVPTVMREAGVDELMPLSTPITTETGELIDSLPVPKGTTVVIPLRAINRSKAVWGENAKDYVPERWMESEKGLTPGAKQIQGYHHLLTFSDGPRICLGRGFAVAEFKSVLSVLIRNFSFELVNGPKTEIEHVMTILPRPRMKGESGYAMPMRVRRLEG
ncbi:cytochrome P450 [Schizopora paradoxa]|uniref:Cytochrome P450 n=1 Tax=Schizopora paradoxa TaxID=27342 RepID=A0A0H2RP96_9AGAM|nr:cytochrome P450 [Schizopora paradoxa]